MDIEGGQVPSTTVRSVTEMTEKIQIYFNLGSPYCRSTMMLAKALKLDVYYKLIDMQAGEHLTPEYLKINPQHTIPTMVEGEFILWDSHAIMQYLLEVYDRDKIFIPKTPKESAVLQQRIMFVATTLGPRFSEYFMAVVGSDQEADPAKKENLIQAVELLDGFLATNIYVAGSKITIADFSAVALIATVDHMNIPLRQYRNLWSWYDKLQRELVEFGYSEYNQEGAKILGAMFRQKTGDLE